MGVAVPEVRGKNCFKEGVMEDLSDTLTAMHEDGASQEETKDK